MGFGFLNLKTEVHLISYKELECTELIGGGLLMPQLVT